MITGDCPYCDAPILEAFQKQGVYTSAICNKCGETFWTLHDRFHPIRVTDEDFKLVYDVDEKTKAITKKEIKLSDPALYIKEMREALDASPQGRAIKKLHDKAIFNSIAYGKLEVPLCEVGEITDKFFETFPKYNEWLAKRRGAEMLAAKENRHLKLVT